MAYTVKQLADLAGVSIRTLHYYDQIDLLKPGEVGANRYRYYTETQVLRLQQIGFFRELQFTLDEIREILDSPGFDELQALEVHREALRLKGEQISTLIHTIDRTIQSVKGQNTMADKDLFEGFDDETQKQYEQEAISRWGDLARQSIALYQTYTPEFKKKVMNESGVIYQDLASLIGQPVETPAVQAVIKRWHEHLRYFYEPSWEMLRGLGQMYVDDPRFHANIAKVDPRLPEFFNTAIQYYAKGKSGKA